MMTVTIVNAGEEYDSGDGKMAIQTTTATASRGSWWLANGANHNQKMIASGPVLIYNHSKTHYKCFTYSFFSLCTFFCMSVICVD